MSVKTSGFDDFDSLLNEVEAELDAPPPPLEPEWPSGLFAAMNSKAHGKDKENDTMKPAMATLKSGIPLPLSPEKGTGPVRRRPLVGGDRPLFGGDTEKNPYDSFVPKTKTNEATFGSTTTATPTRQPASLSPTHVPGRKGGDSAPNMGGNGFRSTTVAADESPKISTRKPFEATTAPAQPKQLPSSTSTTAVSVSAPATRRNLTSSDYLFGPDAPELPEQTTPTKTRSATGADAGPKLKTDDFDFLIGKPSTSVPKKGSKVSFAPDAKDAQAPSGPSSLTNANAGSDFFTNPLNFFESAKLNKPSEPDPGPNPTAIGIRKTEPSTFPSALPLSPPSSFPVAASKKSEDTFSFELDILGGRNTNTAPKARTAPSAGAREPNLVLKSGSNPKSEPKADKDGFMEGFAFGKKSVAKKGSKKGTKVDAADDNQDEGDGGGGFIPKSARLRIPSHIIDEEELKGMSASVKSLYCNQLELLETSYKEQIVTLTQSHQRKEEILKDEIRALHKDYDERLQRYKSQAQARDRDWELDSGGGRANMNQENVQQISELVDQVKSLHKQTKWLLEETQNNAGANIGNGKQILETLTPALESAIKSQLAVNNQKLSQLLSEQLGSGTGAGVGGSDGSLALAALSQRELEKLNATTQKRFDDVVAKIGSISSGKSEMSLRADEKLQDLAKMLDSQLHNLVKLQKKYRNEIVKSVLGSMVHSADTTMVESGGKRDQIKLQLKEFKRDFKRLLAELDNKHGQIQKSHATLIESEQSQVLQAIQNLSNWLQVNGTRQTAATMGLLDNYNNAQGQGANRSGTGSGHGQNFNINGLSLQTELELKLLREERNAFSEAVVQLNVEKRKLSDERIVFEQDKFRFEHDRSRLYELETLLNLKSTDLEELKAKSDVARQEYQKLAAELTRKLSEFEHDSGKQRDVIETIEHKFRYKQQRLNYEKIEVQRDKEFLQKLRRQMLCPNCLSHNPIGSVVIEVDGDGGALNSTNYRTRGDGLEFATSGSMDQLSTRNSASNLIHLQLPSPNTKYIVDDDVLLNREFKHLDDMYNKYFASTK